MSITIVGKKEVIAIGTSPLIVLESCYQKSMHRDIEIYDESIVFGGAWKSIDMFGCKNVEVGCHYISRSAKAYSFISKYLDIELRLANRTFLNMSKAQLSKTSLKWTEKLLVPNQLYRIQTRKPRLFIEFFRSIIDKKPSKQIMNKLRAFIDIGSLKYPGEGCHAITSRLRKKLRENKIPIIHKKIESIYITNNVAYVKIEGSFWEVGEVIIGQNVNIPIRIDAKQINMDKVKREFIHVNLKIEGKKLKNFWCIQKTGKGLHSNSAKNYLLRISDVGRFCTPFDCSFIVICCQLTKEAFDDLKDTNTLLNHLKKLNLISPNSRLLDEHVTRYYDHWITENEYEMKMRDLPKCLNMIATADFSHGIDRYYDKWKSLISE